MKPPLVHHRDETPPIDCPFGHVQRIVTGGAGGVANVHVVKITKGTPHRPHRLRRGVLRAVRHRHDHAGPGDASPAARQRGRNPGRSAAFAGGRPEEQLEFVIFGTPPMTMDDERARPVKPVG